MPFSPAGDPIEKIGHARFPGTVSVSSEVFMGVMRQVALSAVAAGFKNVFLMGDHGGGQNELKLAAENLDADWKAKGVRVFYVADLQAKATQQTNAYLAERKIAPGGHAGVAETSQVMRCSIRSRSELIRRDKLTAAKVSRNRRPESMEILAGDRRHGSRVHRLQGEQCSRSDSGSDREAPVSGDSKPQERGLERARAFPERPAHPRSRSSSAVEWPRCVARTLPAAPTSKAVQRSEVGRKRAVMPPSAAVIARAGAECRGLRASNLRCGHE